MSYRPPSKQPRGAWARHLHEQRRLRDLSQTQAFELVYERVGWSAKSRTAYVAIDMGERQPKGNEATVLGAEFGWPNEEALTEPATDGDVAAALLVQAVAIEHQAAAIAALTTEIRLAALSVLTAQQGTGELLAQLVEAARAGTLDELVIGLREGVGQ